MFIAVPFEIKDYVEDVSPTHPRVQAVILSTSNNRILIINTYFPTDPKIKEFDSIELISTLSAIKGVMKDNEYDNVVWGGDMNADFLRDTVFTNTVDSFLSEMSLKKSWDKYKIDFTRTFEREERTYVSTLDHFLE